MLPITLSLYGARPVNWTQNLPIIGRVLWPVELDEQILVPRIGFEPMTNRIWVYCSTTELSRLIVKRTPSKTLLCYYTVRRRCLPYADTLTLYIFYIGRKFLVVHPQGLEPCSQAWKACDSTSLSSGAYKVIFFLFVWLSVKFFIARIPAHSDTVLSLKRASYLRQRKTNKRTNFLFYIS